jgi:hypothetical protein
MPGLFTTETAQRRKLLPNVRRLIVDLKAEYPPFNLNEIANVTRACFGRNIDVRSVRRVLDEEPMPLKLARNYPPATSAFTVPPSTGPLRGSRRQGRLVSLTDPTDSLPG